MAPSLSQETRLHHLRMECFIAANGFLIWNSIIYTVLLTTTAACRLIKQKLAEFKAWVAAAEERLLDMVAPFHGVDEFVQLWFAAFDKGRVPTYLSVHSTIITLDRQKRVPCIVPRIFPQSDSESDSQSSQHSSQSSSSNPANEEQQQQQQQHNQSQEQEPRHEIAPRLSTIAPQEAQGSRGHLPTYDVRTWIQRQEQTRLEARLDKLNQVHQQAAYEALEISVPPRPGVPPSVTSNLAQTPIAAASVPGLQAQPRNYLNPPGYPQLQGPYPPLAYYLPIPTHASTQSISFPLQIRHQHQPYQHHHQYYSMRVYSANHPRGNNGGMPWFVNGQQQQQQRNGRYR